MKYSLPPIVKEQMKYEPTLPRKSNGNTAQRKEWIDQDQIANLKSRINFIGQRQDKYSLEARDEGTASADERTVLARDIGYDEDYNHQTLDTVSNNPQRDPENNFRNYASPNLDYDEDATFNQEYMRDGFKVIPLDGLTNEYTGQHHIGFYDDVTREDKETGKSVTGFLERNNYLDRI
jgi:hypothetical protein